MNCWPFFDFHLSVEWVLNSLPLSRGSPFSVMQGCVVWSCANYFFSLLESLTDNLQHDMESVGGIRTCFRCGSSFFWWSLVRLNCARNSGVEHLSRPEGCDLTTEGLEPYHDLCMDCGCIILLNCWTFHFVASPDSAAMFPGRYPNIPDAMWQYGWNPTAMNQFGSAEMMQQPPSQTQALNQMRIAQLNEQNSMLQQQLASQAQSHIQHLNQLTHMHQSAPNTPPPQQTQSPPAQAPEPPSSAHLPTNPPVQTSNFDTSDFIKQMKETMVSTIKENAHPQPPPAPLIPPSFPPPSPRPRSRSHRHRSTSKKPDKRPISIPRSPVRKRSQRRKSSRTRSISRRRRRSTSRRRSPDTSVTLRSTSPHRRDYYARQQEDTMFHYSSQPTADLQPASWNRYEQPPSPPSTTHYPSQSHYNPPQHTKWTPWAKWKDWTKPYDTSHSAGQWKDYKKSHDTSRPAGQWIDYPTSLHSPSTVPLITSPTIAISKDPIQSNLAIPLSLEGTFLWTSMVENLTNGHERWSSLTNIQTGWSRPTRSHHINVQWHILQLMKKNSPKRARNFRAWMKGFHLKSWKKRWSFCSAPTFCRTMTCPRASRWNFSLQTCLPSSCHCQIPASSKCHLLLATARITPGHYSTVPVSLALSRFYLRAAKSDRPIGPTTGITEEVTFQHLAHSSWDDKWPTMTSTSHLGHYRNSSALRTRRARANKSSSSAPCTMAPMNTKSSMQEATRKRCSV